MLGGCDLHRAVGRSDRRHHGRSGVAPGRLWLTLCQRGSEVSYVQRRSCGCGDGPFCRGCLGNAAPGRLRSAGDPMKVRNFKLRLRPEVLRAVNESRGSVALSDFVEAALLCAVVTRLRVVNGALVFVLPASAKVRQVPSVSSATLLNAVELHPPQKSVEL